MQIIRLTLQMGMVVVWFETSTSELSVKTDPAPLRVNQESPQRALAPPAAFLIVERPPQHLTPLRNRHSCHISQA